MRKLSGSSSQIWVLLLVSLMFLHVDVTVKERSRQDAILLVQLRLSDWCVNGTALCMRDMGHPSPGYSTAM